MTYDNGAITLMNTQTAVQLLRKSLDRFLAKDMKGWAELCDEDVVAEFPFAPEGSPAKIEGRTALYEYLRNYPSFIDVRAIPTLNTYATDDPNVAIAEWHASGWQEVASTTDRAYGATTRCSARPRCLPVTSSRRSWYRRPVP